MNAKQSWQISQVNEMLTQMETAKHPFIATTNLIEKLDEASLRRFSFKIKFDWLSKSQLDLAVKRFFNVDLDLPAQWKLTPGDFVSVRKRTDIIGYDTPQELYNMLHQEVILKNLEGTKKIGF